MSFFEVFSAYYNNNSSISPSKNNSTESHILLEPIQIPPAINRISLPSQSTAPEESLAPIFVASEQGLDTSVHKRVFKLPRLKSQIWGLDSLGGVSLPAANSYLLSIEVEAFLPLFSPKRSSNFCPFPLFSILFRF